ncbi:MAG: DNA polymerase III subunit epsilon, partial [Dyella sp.]|nr:DNA polymerase III subunit epsilon [Dyella sp.]
CKRLGVDNSARDLHGGLIDAQLLAEVYISMTSGQVVLDLGFEGAQEQGATVKLAPVVLHRRPRVLRANDDELASHERRLDGLDKSAGGTSVWRREDAPAIN